MIKHFVLLKLPNACPTKPKPRFAMTQLLTVIPTWQHLDTFHVAFPLSVDSAITIPQILIDTQPPHCSQLQTRLSYAQSPFGSRVSPRPERRSGTCVPVTKLYPVLYKLVLHDGCTTARVRGFPVQMGEFSNADPCLWLETDSTRLLDRLAYTISAERIAVFIPIYTR